MLFVVPACVDEPAALPAQEPAPRAIQLEHTPSATSSGTEKIGTAAAKRAGSPGDRNALRPLPATGRRGVGEKQPLGLATYVERNPVAAGPRIGPRPARPQAAHGRQGIHVELRLGVHRPATPRLPPPSRSQAACHSKLQWEPRLDPNPTV